MSSKIVSLNDDASFIEVVQLDARSGLQAFGRGEGEFIAGDGVIPGGQVLRLEGMAAALPWRYTALHTGRIFDVAPTEKPVEVRGITIVHREGGAVAIRRYIDWDHVMAQLGILPGRAVVPHH
jgi:hypothetical protein